jgi:hypothetical protein
VDGYVLGPLIYKLGSAVETCTPFVGRVPGELSATEKLSRRVVLAPDGRILAEMLSTRNSSPTRHQEWAVLGPF